MMTTAIPLLRQRSNILTSPAPNSLVSIGFTRSIGEAYGDAEAEVDDIGVAATGAGVKF